MIELKLAGRKGVPRSFWEGVSADDKAAARLAFTAWWDAWQGRRYKLIAIEVPIMSAKLGYAGTPDCIVEDERGRVGIGDWKTGKGIYLDHLLQMVAYKKLIEQEMGITIDFATIMRIHKHSGQLMSTMWSKSFLEGKAMEQWDALVECYDRDKELNKLF